MHTINEMKTMLQTNIVFCEFEKKDGTERSMRCTLMESYLPKFDSDKVTIPKTKKSNDFLSVWDIDKNAWRAFRVNSIRKFEIVTKDNNDACTKK